MPSITLQGGIGWECFSWSTLLRSSCPRQRASTLVTQKTQRAFRSRYRKKDANGRTLPELTTKRREMIEWLAGPGKVFEEPAEDSTNYLSAYDSYGNLKRAGRTFQKYMLAYEQEKDVSDAERARRAEARRKNTSDVTNLPRETANDLRPFPLNQHFQSERVLSEELRDLVFQRVNELKGDISAVSAAYGIDMRRVAAVVRLKRIEERWKQEGKKLAKPYNKAVLAMLPQTRPPRDGVPQPHEGINDLPVHAATRNQLFYPTSESRHFTRTDAAKAFSQHLLPADKRINHPKLIQIQKWVLDGLNTDERRAKVREIQEQEQAKKDAAESRRRAQEAHATRVVPGKRWDFKFRNVSVDSSGPDGRSAESVGIRYGMPHDDRKRGKFKLPISVE